MREPLHGDGFHERIGNKNFVFARGGGIAIEGGLDVGLQNFAHARQATEEFDRDLLRFARDIFFGEPFRRSVFQTFADFVFELADDGIEQGGSFHLDLGGVDGFLVKKTGEQQPQQIAGDGRDDALGREIFAVQMIDAARLRVRRDELVGELRDRFHGEGFTTDAGRNKGFVGRVAGMPNKKRVDMNLGFVKKAASRSKNERGVSPTEWCVKLTERHSVKLPVQSSPIGF